MKYLYSFNSHSDFYNKHMVLEDDNVVLCKDTDINKWHGHYQHPPYDAEIEYLESMDKQCIDTGLIPNQNTSIEIQYMDVRTSISNYFLYGARPGNANDREFTTMPYNSGRSDFRFGNKSAGTVYTYALNTKYKIISSKNKFTLYNSSNSVIHTNTVTNNTFSSSCNLFLFGTNYNGTPAPVGGLRIYMFKFIDNSTLILDMIPVRVGNKGYMYDKVSGQLFGNSGTGDFVLGPDIQPIEYLESTGTQYINTGVIMNQSSSIEIDFQMTDLASTSSIFGGREGYKTKDFSWMYISSEKKIRRNYGTLEKYSGTYDTVRRTYIHNGRNLINNGAIFDTFDSQTFECPVTTYLFSINNNGATINTGKLRIYRCKITGKNKIVNLIPVRIGNVGYMYDRVSGKLFGNAGTGSFILGPDL